MANERVPSDIDVEYTSVQFGIPLGEARRLLTPKNISLKDWQASVNQLRYEHMGENAPVRKPNRRGR